jgi:hypothetical protein
MSLTLFACSKTNNNNQTEMTKADDASLQTDEKIYWVNSLKSKCADTGSMECLQIQQGNELKPDGWALSHSTIQGFEYEQGYIYKIIVAEQPVTSKQTPADDALVNYHLVKVINGSLRLNDIWALETIQGNVEFEE